MSRLLQGDVGSGKTVVALYACLVAVAHKRQAAIMAPTEILAQQHAQKIEEYLAGSRVRRAFLHGGLSREARRERLAAIEAGEIDLVVGTQALLEKDVGFADLAMIVVDEQHRFGVLQRAGIRTKGPTPHFLVMTATPIPRTLAMTVFGDLDASILRASPPGRGRIETHVVAAREWDALMRDVRRRLEAGEQAYIVCPRIGEDVGQAEPTSVREPDAAEELASARREHERLVSGPLKGLSVGLLHGGMRSGDKDATLREFRSGAHRALVATTVIEVGVDVPNASIMVVQHAERFGLAQLHQLRGRVGRGVRDSSCFLVSHTRRGAASKSNERLAVLAQTTDGFKIAEADLRHRGPGELLGTRQHGLPELRIGDLVRDFSVLEQARQDAFELIEIDPELKRPEHARFRERLIAMFKGKLSLIEAG
jgi:ATP-dependent DNA helicase RecG